MLASVMESGAPDPKDGKVTAPAAPDKDDMMVKEEIPMHADGMVLHPGPVNDDHRWAPPKLS